MSELIFQSSCLFVCNRRTQAQELQGAQDRYSNINSEFETWMNTVERKYESLPSGVKDKPSLERQVTEITVNSPYLWVVL